MRPGAACGATVQRFRSEHMKKSTEKKLRARGWRVGSAADFLGLSPEEAAFLEIKVSLASELRKKRRQRRLTQTALAALVESSQSRVAKMEAGAPSVSLD